MSLLRTALSDMAEYHSRCPKAAPLELLALCLRYARLHLPGPLVARPSAQPATPVVIALTTVPSRIGSIRPVLRSLLDQTMPAGEIRLHVPHRSVRQQADYHAPSWLRGATPVRVLRSDRDWGPASRLIPSLQNKPSTGPILTLDDDMVYPPDLVETFLAWHRWRPKAALAYRGWRIPESRLWRDSVTVYGTRLHAPRRVDVITGTWGVLVEPTFFDDAVTDYDAYPPDAFYVDDIWFSGHLARRGVERLVIPARLPPLPTRWAERDSLIGTDNADGRHNDVMLRAFAPFWDEASSAPEG